MKKLTFTNYLNRTEFKKVINYHLNKRGRVKRIGTFNSKSVIFDVEVFENNHLFSIDNCRFQSCFINKKTGRINATFTCGIENLNYLLMEIAFFQKFPKDRAKMEFPEVELKNEYTY